MFIMMMGILDAGGGHATTMFVGPKKTMMISSGWRASPGSRFVAP